MTGQLTVSGQGSVQKNRAANRRSARSRALKATIALLVLMAAAGAGFYFWLENRNSEPMVLTVGTGPFGSDSDQLMREVAEVLERHSTSLRLKVRTTRDPSENIALLNQGAIDLAAIRSDTPVVADVRMVAGLYPDNFLFISRLDGPFQRLQDLAQARIAIPPPGDDGFRSFFAIVDHYDIPDNRVTWVARNFELARRALLNGTVDGLFIIRSLRDHELLKLFEDAGLKKIPLSVLSVTQADAIALKRPFIFRSTVPRGAFSGSAPTPASDTVTAAVTRILVTREDVSTEAIRELTAVLFEHRLDLTIRFELAAAVSPPDEERGLSVPLHAGAAAYYDRDKPSYLQENAEPIALGVTLTAMFVSGLLAVRRRFLSQQKNRADTYNYQLLSIIDRVGEASDRASIEALRDELNGILRQIVVALDTDEVTDEGFQSFSFLFEAVREQLDQRELLLAKA